MMSRFDIPCSVTVVMLVLYRTEFTYTQDVQKPKRLAGGLTPFEGRVEQLDGGTWTHICVSEWDFLHADSVCIELGFPGVMMEMDYNDFADDVVLSCNDNSYQVFSVRCHYSSFIGCYRRRNGLGRTALYGNNNEFVIGPNGMTIERCLKNCRENNQLFGSLRENKCRCGNTLPSNYFYSRQSDSKECSLKCTAREDQICGGDNNRFNAVFNTTLGSCQANFTAPSGWIVSPGFPGFDEPATSCVWNVTVQGDNVINVTLRMNYLMNGDELKFFQIRGHNQPMVLTSDDGRGVIDHNLGITQSNTLRIEFTSETSPNSGDLEEGGFVIYYNSTSAVEDIVSSISPVMPKTTEQSTTDGTERIISTLQPDTTTRPPHPRPQTVSTLLTPRSSSKSTVYHPSTRVTENSDETPTLMKINTTTPVVKMTSNAAQEPITRYHFHPRLTEMYSPTTTKGVVGEADKRFSDDSSVPLGTILGVSVVFAIVLIATVVAIVVYRKRRSLKNTNNGKKKDHAIQLGNITYGDILDTTVVKDTGNKTDTTNASNGVYYSTINASTAGENHESTYNEVYDSNVAYDSIGTPRAETTPGLNAESHYQQYIEILPKPDHPRAQECVDDGFVENVLYEETKNDEEGFVDNIAYESTAESKNMTDRADVCDGFVDNVLYETGEPSGGSGFVDNIVYESTGGDTETVDYETI